MRKLSLLIALCTLLTIGGVYATWTYTNESIPSQIGEYELLLTGEQTVGNHGTFTITTNALSMTIDPKAGTTHTTSLDIEGTITITFTPSEYAPQEIKAYGPEAEFYFSLTNENWTYVEYEGAAARPVITLEKDTPDATHLINPSNSVEEDRWVSDGNGNFTYTISTELLRHHITLTEFNLDTRSDYFNYQAALANGKISLTVQDTIA